jgi:hypothetical protein
VCVCVCVRCTHTHTHTHTHIYTHTHTLTHTHKLYPAQTGVLGHVVNKQLPLIVARMRRLELDMDGQGEIYTSRAFWDSISTVVLSDTLFEVAFSLLVTRDQYSRLKAMGSARFHQEIRAGAFEAATQIVLEIGNRQDSFKNVVVLELQKICGDTSNWSAKKTVMDKFERSTMWGDWTAAGHTRDALQQFILRLKRAARSSK